jgi:hypothetical protein
MILIAVIKLLFMDYIPQWLNISFAFMVLLHMVVYIIYDLKNYKDHW